MKLILPVPTLVFPYPPPTSTLEKYKEDLTSPTILNSLLLSESLLIVI